MGDIGWMDVSSVPFDALLLLERAQIAWLPGWNFPRPEISLALAANPKVVWFLRNKCPEVSSWLDAEMARAGDVGQGSTPSPEITRQAEVAVLRTMVDLMVYALDPSIYDQQPFLEWDSRELTDLVDFSGKIVLDIGSGTGRLAFVAAPKAQVVYPVEPVGNLRAYLREKARRLGCPNVYPVDGLITAIPFPADFADVTMSGHVYGDEPQAELDEVLRVTRPGGTVIFCPGNNDRDDATHAYLVERGFSWSVFIEPPNDRKRKYWMTKEG